MSIDVKWFTSDMRGAPVVNGQAGTLIAMLDACLITGFGLVNATAVNVSGGIATATLPSGQSFVEHAVILIDGATPAELNGEARVLSTSSTQITWATSAPDGPATGTVTIKYAPQGQWEKAFSGTNKAVYRSTDVTGNRHCLRVDDAGTTTARVRGFETMADVDTGTGPFPTDAQMSGGGYWHKSRQANATAVRWRLFADARLIVPTIAAGSGQNASYLSAPARGFGELLPLRTGGDAWGTVLSFNAATEGNVAAGSLDGLVSTGNGMLVCPRAWNGLGGAVVLDTRPYCGGTGNTMSGNDNTLGAAPSEIDGTIRPSLRFVQEQGTAKPPRLNVPGIYTIPQSGISSLLSDGDTLIGAGPMDGRVLMAVSTTGSSYGGAPAGMYLVDISGPWR